VQRQGLKKLFDMDLKNIKVLAQLLDKFDPKTDGASRDWVSIYEESAKLLYKEINYEAEALNSIRFRDNFAGVPWIKVPDVLLNMTTSRVVTMEYVPGIKINDIERIEAAGIDRQLLAKRSAESYLSQLCRYGFFHVSS
jgi:predicted unusual protein kinase regulating ubiquinone biosynthesis (AarF/ABC1/UbiB family)